MEIIHKPPCSIANYILFKLSYDAIKYIFKCIIINVALGFMKMHKFLSKIQSQTSQTVRALHAIKYGEFCTNIYWFAKINIFCIHDYFAINYQFNFQITRSYLNYKCCSNLHENAPCVPSEFFTLKTCYHKIHLEHSLQAFKHGRFCTNFKGFVR